MMVTFFFFLLCSLRTKVINSNEQKKYITKMIIPMVILSHYNYYALELWTINNIRALMFLKHLFHLCLEFIVKQTH